MKIFKDWPKHDRQLLVISCITSFISMAALTLSILALLSKL